MPVLVACVGNPLVSDDGAGPAVYRALKDRPRPAGTRLLLLSTAGLRLVEELTDERGLIVVDAVRLGGRPGTVHVLDWEQLPPRPNRPALSSHGLSVREAVELRRRLYPAASPQWVRLVGIEGECFDEFADMTPAVSAAIDPAATIVLEQAAALGNEKPAGQARPAEKAQ